MPNITMSVTFNTTFKNRVKKVSIKKDVKAFGFGSHQYICLYRACCKNHWDI